MTEPTEAPVAEQPQESPEQTASTRRGRPRPDSTIERDRRVLETIGAKSLTRDEVATALSISPTQAYLSLYRLRATDQIMRVREGSQHRWRQKSDVTATPETPAEPVPVA